MRLKKIQHENWEQSEYLPDYWLFKITWEGMSGTRWSSNITYLSKEGDYFDSMKNVLSFMESSPNYNYEDITNCKYFLKQRSRETSEQRFSWEFSDSLPKGWKTRKCNGESKTESESIPSPQGDQFKSRFSAILNMFKCNADPGNIEQMKDKLVHEGWENIHLSNQLSKILTKQRDDWETDNETLPKGWKKRVTPTREYFMRPDGKQFMTRSIALQTMVKEGFEEDEVEEIRAKLVYEGWKTDSLLPERCLYKKWEGHNSTKNKIDSSYQPVQPTAMSIPIETHGFGSPLALA